jgi:hypothetical protein
MSAEILDTKIVDEIAVVALGSQALVFRCRNWGTHSPGRLRRSQGIVQFAW